MPRHPRAAPGGYVYHALNRGVGRLALFQKDGDYFAFERVLDDVTFPEILAREGLEIGSGIHRVKAVPHYPLLALGLALPQRRSSGQPCSVGPSS